MSSELPTPDHSPQDIPTPAHQQQALKPRVLACILCQQRKVKCDRKFPCSHCIRAGAQCMSAALAPRQRKRRFPERELLDRLRHYENLLRQNNIPFEPLHSSELVPGSSGSAHNDGAEQAGTTSESSTAAGSYGNTTLYKPKNFWHAMNRNSQGAINDDDSRDAEIDAEDDDSDSSNYIIREKVVKNAWNNLYDSSDHLLFCSRNTNVDLSTLHPPQIQIFKIWQLYLENFDPLLKVTHAPTLQARIIDAAGDITNIDAPLEALMFSIYCVVIFSLDENECERAFGSSRESLLSSYQLGAREALLNCRFLRTDDRDCLTALHFYLMTIKPSTDPRALSAILASAIRIAQRMGLHDESANDKHDALEAELRRRLWWSLVLFDARISEMTDFRLGLLLPTWDCRPPLNANDFDFRAGMKTPPEVHGMVSEALFAVVRGEIGNYLRHCSFHLDFINPALKSIARKQPEGDELGALEQMIEGKYLRYCDLQNPLHFMVTWWARGQLAKLRFIRSLSDYSKVPTQRTEEERNASISYALAMLDCDTRIMSNKRTRGFRWLTYLNFPFPAYVHIVQDLRKRPNSEHARVAWDIMSENCTARFMDVDGRDKFMERKDNPFFMIFAGVVFQAWSARETAMANLAPNGEKEAPPIIVTQIRARMAKLDAESAQRDAQQQDANEPTEADDQSMFLGTDFTSFGVGQDHAAINQGFPLLQEQHLMGFNTNTWGWPAPSFNPMMGHGW
ncbi:putative C6 transcription factor [Phaeosphaeria sp. MPI-PUGE-AT-0046c]|nr:putative C6 transcription factor [Phaeosphaeria sp. MPI-PUGE-AT-0046c]